MVAADLGRCTLVTGPASSGKSLWAERLACASHLPVLYVATGPELPDDAGWQARLHRHRERRPSDWMTREAGAHLPETLTELNAGCLGLVDSLGTWVAAELDRDAAAWTQRVQALQAAVSTAAAPLILVAEEAAWGVVPPTRAGLLFRDRLGLLLQQLMPLCDRADLVLHGRVLDLLSLSQPIDRPVQP